jgi:hypothetical protein
MHCGASDGRVGEHLATGHCNKDERQLPYIKLLQALIERPRDVES